jgi:predicted ATPase/class 3 adenylate cyclase
VIVVVGAPSGTVTFLFTDIEGSTRLWEAVPDAMRPALARHDQIVRTAAEGHGGFVFSTGGDGFAVAFSRAGDALAAALEAQAALNAESWPKAAAIRVRMGLHTGEADEREGDYYGPAVNRAARLTAVAHGGQVVCSAVTAGLADPAGLRSLGPHRLRDLGAPEPVFQVGGGVFPALRSVDVVPGNLPTQVTELVGRMDDVARLAPLVGPERLLTLTGAGGIGKTRLALAVAAAVAPRFADGCWFVELAPATSGTDVGRAVAAAMGSPATELAALSGYIADRQALIVLDNCEHVLADAARVAQALVTAGPDAVIVATSREPLGVAGEVVRGVASLATPDDADASAAEAMGTSAVRLFATRALAATEQFVLDDANVGAVVEICRRLDGVPLAIELAAARVRAMSPGEIARRLGERFRLLAAAGRPLQERHRTLAAAVAWSHDLLSDDERLVFRRLAVFPASFDLEAAERVTGTGGAVDVVDAVVRLVERSLVQYDSLGDRYRMLETLRQYGAERLADAEETADTREAHTAWCLCLVERLAPRLLDAGYDDAIDRLMLELDNLRAAAAWLAENHRWGDLGQLAQGTWIFLMEQSLGDGTRWLRQAIDNSDSLDQARVDALAELSTLLATMGDLASAIALADESLALAGRLGLHPSLVAWASKAQCDLIAGDGGAAVDAAEEGQRAAGAAGCDQLWSALLEALRGAALAVLGEHDASRRVAAESVAMAQRTGHGGAIGTAFLVAVAGRLNTSAPDLAGALDIIERNRHHRCFHRGDKTSVWFGLQEGVALAGGRNSAAVSHLAGGLRVADRLQLFPAVELAVRALAYDAACDGHLGTAASLLGYRSANLLTTPAAPIPWLDERVRRALDELPSEVRAIHFDRGAAMSRRELMALVESFEQLTKVAVG